MEQSLVALDNCGQVCLPKLDSKMEREIQYGDNGKPVVYGRRWFMLSALCGGYFMWNLHTLRQTPLVAEYAHYFGTTNEFKPGDGELGIDFFGMLDALVLIFFYPIAGMLVDNYGLRIMVIGNIGQCISAWWFFFAFTNYNSVLISRILASVSGGMITASVLRIVTQYFPAEERALAVGLGVIFSEVGAAASLIVGPFFYEGDGESIIDTSLLSCKESFIDGFQGQSGNTSCTDDAEEKFCCRIPTDIDGLNLFMAIATTFTTIYAVIVVRDKPPTPPSKSAIKKKSPSFSTAMRLMFSNRNYTQICVADFIMSGPPQTLFGVISRVFPPSVQQYDFIGTPY